MTKTLITQSELTIYRSAYGNLCYVPGKSICKDMVMRIPLHSEIIFLGVKTLGKNQYDEYRYIWGSKSLEFITPLGAILH
jgi:hypothetical protein